MLPTLLHAASTVRVVVVNVYILSEPPLCLRRRRVVFLYSRTFFRKKYAQTSRTIPFRTSRRISRNVSMIITSFRNYGMKIDNQPPQQYSAATPFYHCIVFLEPINLRQIAGSDRRGNKIKEPHRGGSHGDILNEPRFLSPRSSHLMFFLRFFY